MNNCFNHPKVEALSICHSCGKEFCELCLDEGKEYYYCKNSECHESLNKELQIEKFSKSVVCPGCKTEFEISAEEHSKGKIHCTECDKIINFILNPPKLMDIENYAELFSTLNQGNIAIIRSILDNNEIDYYILGESFLSVRPLLEAARIFVATSQIEEAKKILEDLDLNTFGVSIK
jgi:hypothetical protein